MKTLTRFVALAALAVILGSCSFAVGALNHKKSRVVASAIWRGRSAAPAARTVRSRSAVASQFPLVRKSRVLPPRPASAVVGSSRSAARSASRDISASTDIDYVTYTIVDLDPNSGEAEIEDYLDPYYPYIDVFLTPGQNYRITVDVSLLASSPALLAGAAVGISAYGDSADIAVPADGSDVWVDLSIHAMGIVIRNQLATSTTYAYLTPGGSQLTGTLSSSFPTRKPLDKFFYTSDSLLYYFNWQANAVYQCTNLGASAAVLGFDGANGPTPDSIQIYAICPDPAWPGWFYVVGINALNVWELYAVNYDPAGVVGPTTADWLSYGAPLDIKADVEAGRAGATVVVTGVAADLYGDVDVTFYNTAASGAGTPVSGLIEYYFGSLYAQYVPDTTLVWTSTDSIFTDVMCSGSTVYVLGSPNTSVGSVGNSTGTADIYIFDFYLNQLSANPSPVSSTYSGSVPSVTGGTSLIQPNKFVGMVQGGSFFLSQINFAGAGGTDYLSAVSLDLSSVRSVP